MKKGFTAMVDNKMHGFGLTDLDKKIIKVNVKRSKEDGSPGEVLDSMVHEIAHVNHPQMHEKNIRKHTAKVIEHMGQKQKQKVYNLFEH